MKNLLSFPGIEKDSSREAILRILVERFPLPLKLVRSDVREKQKRSLSLQAVHKALRSLMQQNVVTHSVLGYQITTKWSWEQKQSADKIIESLDRWEGSSKLIDSIEKEGRISAHFENLASAETFWVRAIKQVAHTEAVENPCKFIGINHTPYWLFINLGASLALHREVVSLGYKLHYFFLSRNPLTKWGADFYKSIGVKTKITKSNLIPNGVYSTIINDYIIQGTLSKQATSDLQKITDKYKLITDIPPALMLKVFNAGGGMTVTIEKNQSFTQTLKSAFHI